ncbi:hypothetical protein [Trichocoleus sp. FACHB-832]|nr:hypothetical protein [Trichocoleus sp. FACHB-832]
MNKQILGSRAIAFSFLDCAIAFYSLSPRSLSKQRLPQLES